MPLATATKNNKQINMQSTIQSTGGGGGTSGVEPVKVKSPSEKSTSCGGAADFLDPQNSALILGT